MKAKNITITEVMKQASIRENKSLKQARRSTSRGAERNSKLSKELNKLANQRPKSVDKNNSSILNKKHLNAMNNFNQLIPELDRNDRNKEVENTPKEVHNFQDLITNKISKLATIDRKSSNHIADKITRKLTRDSVMNNMFTKKDSSSQQLASTPKDKNVNSENEFVFKQSNDEVKSTDKLYSRRVSILKNLTNNINTDEKL
mmetsp:Transcript_106519/g.229404  ORF Transcript_106519/g.229404 Transcript_106519/m.229404 type:complete len:202 (-) Transcript_106519:34-639(-)